MAEQAQLSKGADGKLQAGFAALRQRWSALQGAQRRLFVFSVLGFAGLAGIASWWTSRTDWRTLFNGLEARDASQVQQQLSAAGITYQTTPDGTAVQVPAEELDKARVAIAAKGMPQSGRLGFELFDKPNWVGSEFDERVNFQRALEGELEHTIETMEAVRSARVHVVLPKQGAFSSEDQPAKASVVLKLRRSGLPREETESIRTMIAGAVEGLQAGAVTLIDADGRADFSQHDAHGVQREDEAALEAKLIQVLEPLAGAGNVHATVNLSYLTGSEEHTDEVYDPTQSVPVTTQKTEQSALNTKSGGIAGTASNTPAAAPVSNTQGTAPAGGTAAVQPAAQQQTSREESTSYAVTRHVSHTEQGPGSVRRIAAAIVINDRLITQTGGKPVSVWKPRSADEMKRMEQLAQAAVGFETKRGDSVVLQNISFSDNAEEKSPALIDRVGSQARDLLRSQPSLLRTLGMGACLLVLGFMVLRPLGKQAVRLLDQPLLPAVAGGGSAVAPLQLNGTGNTVAAAEPVQPPLLASSAPPDAQNVFDRVTEHIRTEPIASARLVQAWIGGSEDND
jgi:flagellar M-ring protein FliF